MSIPINWVDRIFEKLTLVYGREFMNRWQGLDVAAVKADWAHELDGFDKWPEAIAFALQNLPADRPPTVLQFRDMCRKAPPKPVPLLPQPKADPARVQAELAKIRGIMAMPKAYRSLA